MKHKNVKLFAILFLVLGITGLKAQEAIVTSGQNASGGGGSVSYSIGQIVYTTNTGITGSMAQGVQQPYEISILTGIEEATGITLFVSAYPNPTTDFLTLKVDTFPMNGIQSLSYKLFDINGKFLENKKLTGNETSISMRNYSPAIYFLKVAENNKEVKTFKIIKNQ